MFAEDKTVVSADKKSVVSADKTSAVSADKTSVVSKTSQHYGEHRGRLRRPPVLSIERGCLGRPQMSCLPAQQSHWLQTQTMTCSQTREMSYLEIGQFCRMRTQDVINQGGDKSEAATITRRRQVYGGDESLQGGDMSKVGRRRQVQGGNKSKAPTSPRWPQAHKCIPSKLGGPGPIRNLQNLSGEIPLPTRMGGLPSRHLAHTGQTEHTFRAKFTANEITSA